jgi:branched-chain amino acid transport system permease protein
MSGLIKYERFEHFTGGGGGINLFESAARTRPVETTDPITFETISEPIKFLGFEISSFNEWLYYLCWVVALVMLAVAWLLLRGKTGRSFRAVRDSELAAASSGVNLATYKTLAFGISAFYAGVAGALLAIATTFVNPDTFPITLSIFLLVGVVVGGLGSLWPLVFGAIFIQFLPLWAQEVSKAQGAPAVVYGVILILVMILLPGGAAGLIRRLQAFTRGYHRGR